MAEEPKDEEGRPYHLRLTKKDVGRVALLPGDRARVPKIAERFEGARDLGAHREFRAFVGRIGKESVMAVSTGIGGPAMAIAVEELARLGVQVMIRVGTCGAITPRAKLGSVVIADAALRMDGTSNQCAPPGYPAAAAPGVVTALVEGAGALGKKVLVGITATTDSFYAGQGRRSFGGYFPSDKTHLVEDLRSANVLCFDMETATLFTLGRIFRLKTGALFAVVANRSTNSFKPEAGVDDVIDVAVEGVRRLGKFSV